MKKYGETNTEKKLIFMYNTAYEHCHNNFQASQERKRIKRIMNKIERRNAKKYINDQLN